MIVTCSPKPGDLVLFTGDIDGNFYVNSPGVVEGIHNLDYGLVWVNLPELDYNEEVYIKDCHFSKPTVLTTRQIYKNEVDKMLDKIKTWLLGILAAALAVYALLYKNAKAKAAEAAIKHLKAKEKELDKAIGINASKVGELVAKSVATKQKARELAKKFEL